MEGKENEVVEIKGMLGKRGEDAEKARGREKKRIRTTGVMEGS